MKRSFQPFEFQLSLPENNQKSPNKKKVVSVMVREGTDAQQVAAIICLQNGLGQSLVPILSQFIEKQIDKQMIETLKRSSRSRSGHRPLHSPLKQPSNKTKSFKSRFCQYLKEDPISTKTIPSTQCIDQTEFNDSQTFRNCSFVIDPSTINTEDQEYSFRPSCIEISDLSDRSCCNSYEISEFSTRNSRCSNGSTMSKSPIKSHCQVKNQQKSNRTVFDNLYEHSKLLVIKKEVDRKKSLEKLTFKPQMNQMSKKIVMMKNSSKQNIKNQHQSQYNNLIKTASQSKLSKSQIKPSKPNLTPSSCSASLAKSTIKRATPITTTTTRTKQNIQPHQRSISPFNPERTLSTIYDRGMMFRKKSQDKLAKMKHDEFMDEIKSCSFKPQFFSRVKINESRVA